jgi:16S rRNA (guanine966-N2)-methyltransferase
VSGSLRVIAGVYGGRGLKAPRGMNTRPTSARVREALFSVLGDVSGRNVLDLYAGTGALAIEALSRGAARAVLVEHDRAALACIRENLAALGAETRTELIPRAIAKASGDIVRRGPFELILCDPPWSDLDRAADELRRLVSGGALAEGGTLTLEHSAKAPRPEIAGLDAFDQRHWGDTAVSLFRRASGSGPQT